MAFTHAYTYYKGVTFMHSIHYQNHGSDILIY